MEDQTCSAFEAALEALIDRAVERKLAQPATPKLVSAEGLADLLRVKPRTIKTLREKGLPAVKVGGLLFYDVEEAHRWIEAHV
jgi:hypothetical protein